MISTKYAFVGLLAVVLISPVMASTIQPLGNYSLVIELFMPMDFLTAGPVVTDYGVTHIMNTGFLDPGSTAFFIFEWNGNLTNNSSEGFHNVEELVIDSLVVLMMIKASKTFPDEYNAGDFTYMHTEIPYDGWLMVTPMKTNEMTSGESSVKGYVGSIDGSAWLMVVSTEPASFFGQLLSNINVVTKQEEGMATLIAIRESSEIARL